jgi:hypothetical protein
MYKRIRKTKGTETMKIKFVRKIGQVSGESLYEIHHGENHVGFISKTCNGWQVDCETPDRKQRIRNFTYLKTCKEYAREIRA